MKKLLFLLAVLTNSIAWAENLTTGNLKLIMPSTSTPDRSRVAGDKLNSNFQIIDSSVTNVMSQIVALSIATSTLNISTTLIINQESPDISNRTYYLHDETTGTVSVYRLLSSSPSALPEVQRTVNVPIGAMVSISSFITTGGDPGVRKIPAGVWSFTTWGQVASIANSVQIIVTISTTDFAGNGAAEVLSSTSTAFLDLNVDRFDLVAVQTQDLFVSTSQRILVQYFAKSQSLLGINTSIFYAGTSRFSHLTTPIGAVYKFTQLSDTPQTYIGQRGKVLAVNDEETATVFISTAGGGAATVMNSTQTMDITIAGSPFISTQTIFGVPGTTRSPGRSTWTITDLWADCALGSSVGVIGFDLLYSSWGGNTVGGNYSKLFDRMDVSTVALPGGGGVLATSLFRSSISVIGAHTYLGVGISTMPQSGNLPSDCHVHFYYWEANKYSP